MPWPSVTFRIQKATAITLLVGAAIRARGINYWEINYYYLWAKTLPRPIHRRHPSLIDDPSFGCNQADTMSERLAVFSCVKMRLIWPLWKKELAMPNTHLPFTRGSCTCTCIRSRASLVWLPRDAVRVYHENERGATMVSHHPILRTSSWRRTAE